MCKTIILVLVAALTIYALSIGPVFAYYARSCYDSSLSPMPLAVFSVYRPLFRDFPETTYRYLALWNVSEIEVFFITNPKQNWPSEPQAD